RQGQTREPDRTEASHSRRGRRRRCRHAAGLGRPRGLPGVAAGGAPAGGDQMKIVATAGYVGPNIYALVPVHPHTLDLGQLEDWPTGRLGAAFIDPLLEWLPGLKEHGCSYGEAGGFIRRMREGEGTWLGHVMEHVAIELQNQAGIHVTFGKTRTAGEPGLYHMIYEYEQPQV